MTRLEFNPVEPEFASGPDATFGETYDAALGREQLVGETSARNRAMNEAYAPLIGFFNETIRPMDPDFFAHGIVGSVRHDGATGSPLSLDTWNALQDSGMHPDQTLLETIAAELEEAGIAIPEGATPEAIMARRANVEAEIRDQVSQYDEVLARGGLGGQLAGGLVASLDNVETIATLPIGASVRTGILGTAAIEGLIAGTTEAAATPARNEFLRQLGLPEESILENFGYGAAAGAVFGGTIKGLQLGVPKVPEMLGRMIVRTQDMRALADAFDGSPEPVLRGLSEQVRQDALEQDLGTGGRPSDPDAIDEHQDRLTQAMTTEGTIPAMPDRPVVAVPAQSILNGEIEEVSPRDLLVQPEVFQFKSDADASGVTEKLREVGEWRSERAGIVLVYEYADGTRAIADGHQRTALANRIMDAGGPEIRMAARIIREEDGFTPEDVRVIAAAKNIAEAADGMTTAMARDAAKIMRVSPDLINELPRGPGIARARDLSALSDDAFALVINDVVPENYAALIGRLVDDPQLHLSMMRLLEKTDPASAAQAESIIRQALAAPVEVRTTADLFGDQTITESLYLERAKVLERAMRDLRQDRSILRTLTEQDNTITSIGQNRLDTEANRNTRAQTELALEHLSRLAHRAGPISEALNDGAKAYKNSGRLKDAAERVVGAIRQQLEQGNLNGSGVGQPRRAAKPQSESAATSDPNADFAEPNGPGAQAQIANTRIEPLRTQEAREWSDPAELAKAATDAVSRMFDGDAPKRLIRAQNLPEIELDAFEHQVKRRSGHKTADDAWQAGRRNHGQLNKVMGEAAAAEGLTFKKAPLKKKDGVIRKVRDKYRGRAWMIGDIARTGVTVQSVDQIERILQALNARFHVLDEGLKRTEHGYIDHKATVIFDDGSLGEVQFWPPRMLDAKNAEGHKLYEISRDPAQPAEARAEADRRMIEIYGEIERQLDPSFAEKLGSSAPRADSNAAARSPETSSARSSDRTSAANAGSGSDQASSTQSAPVDRSSDNAASSDPSNLNNRMGTPSGDNVGATARNSNDAEATPAGIQQLMPGVKPITARDRIQSAADRPLVAPTRTTDTEIGGLFDPDDPARAMDDLFEQVPVGVRNVDGELKAETVSRQDLAAELDADDEFADQLGLCLK